MYDNFNSMVGVNDLRIENARKTDFFVKFIKVYEYLKNHNKY